MLQIKFTNRRSSFYMPAHHNLLCCYVNNLYIRFILDLYLLTKHKTNGNHKTKLERKPIS